MVENEKRYRFCIIDFDGLNCTIFHENFEGSEAAAELQQIIIRNIVRLQCFVGVEVSGKSGTGKLFLQGKEDDMIRNVLSIRFLHDLFS